MKHSVSIKHNIVFNPEDVFKESVEIKNEGENEKILQNLTEKPSETTTETKNSKDSTENLSKKDSHVLKWNHVRCIPTNN